MFYTVDLLSRKGVLSPVWLSATRPGSQKVRLLLDVPIADVIAGITHSQYGPLSLRLSANLLVGAVRIFDVQVSSCSRRAATIRHVLSVAHTKQAVTLDPNRKRSRGQSKHRVLQLASTQRRGGAAADESEVGTDMESAFEGYEYEEEDDAEAAADGGARGEEGGVRQGAFHWAPPLRDESDINSDGYGKMHARGGTRSTSVRLLYYEVDAPRPAGAVQAGARGAFAPIGAPTGTAIGARSKAPTSTPAQFRGRGGAWALLGPGHENSEFGSDPDASSDDERFGGIVLEDDSASSAAAASGSARAPKGAARFRAGRAAAVFDEAALIPAAERGEAARGAHAPSPDSDVRAGAISALLQLPSPSLSKRNAGASPNVGAAPRSQHSGRSSFRGGDGDGAARSGEKRYVRAGENAGDLQEGDDEYDDEYDSEFDGEENSGFISPTGLSSGTSTISPPLRKKNIASKKKTKKNGAARRRRRNASFGIDAVTTLSREALALRRNPTAAYINAELFKAQHGPGTGLAGGLGHKKRARVDLLQRNMPKTLRPLYASLLFGYGKVPLRPLVERASPRKAAPPPSRASSPAAHSTRKRRYSAIEQLRGDGHESRSEGGVSNSSDLLELDPRNVDNERWSATDGHTSATSMRRRASSFGGRPSIMGGDLDSSFFSDADNFDFAAADSASPRRIKSADLESDDEEGTGGALGGAAIEALSQLRGAQDEADAVGDGVGGSGAATRGGGVLLSTTLRALKCDRARAARFFFNVLELHGAGLIAARSSEAAAASSAAERRLGSSFREIEIVVFDE